MSGEVLFVDNNITNNKLVVPENITILNRKNVPDDSFVFKQQQQQKNKKKKRRNK